MNLAPHIDHTILRPDCTKSDIQQICQECIEYSFKAVCVPPYYVKDAVNYIADNPVKVATVIGFPMGYSATAAKVEEIKRALNDGATEIDAVVNISAIKNQAWTYVRNDVESMTMAVHLKGKVIKLIIETSLLSAEEIEKICTICAEIGVDFVKTSTGYNGEGASPEIVSSLRQYLPEKIKIKASGGIKNFQQAQALIDAGASRLGTSSGTELLQTTE